MTKALLIIVALILSVIIYFIVLGKISRSSEPATLTDGTLPPCPDKPNCVCSEYDHDRDHFIQALRLENVSTGDAIKLFEIIIVESGGEIKTINNLYLSATFSSSLFGFVDDVEIRIDVQQNMIHFRSASRVGHSDMGVNRKRMDAIKTRFQEMSRES